MNALTDFLPARKNVKYVKLWHKKQHDGNLSNYFYKINVLLCVSFLSAIWNVFLSNQTSLSELSFNFDVNGEIEYFESWSVGSSLKRQKTVYVIWSFTHSSLWSFPVWFIKCKPLKCAHLQLKKKVFLNHLPWVIYLCLKNYNFAVFFFLFWKTWSDIWHKTF